MNPKESATAFGSRASPETAAADAVRPMPERCKLNCAWNIPYIAKVSFCRGKQPRFSCGSSDAPFYRVARIWRFPEAGYRDSGNEGQIQSAIHG